MPLFRIKGDRVEALKSTNFDKERDLQRLVEANLDTFFGCRFVATEFQTGERHGGRIDTLALSEDGNPVIIEYKKEASSDLLNQSLFYLSWIQDHRGDFELAAMKALGPNTEVEWSDIRVICLAPSFKKYDLHAVGMMGANIELWQYHLFGDGSLYLEEAYRKSGATRAGSRTTATAPATAIANEDYGGKNPVMVEAGRKAALTRATATYTMTEHVEKATADGVRELYESLRERVTSMSDSVEEAPKKLYVAYKVTKNFLCVETRRHKIIMYLKLNPEEVKPLPPNARDVREIGHFGTGDLEMTVRTEEELDAAMPLIAQALDAIGE